MASLCRPLSLPKSKISRANMSAALGLAKVYCLPDFGKMTTQEVPESRQLLTRLFAGLE